MIDARDTKRSQILRGPGITMTRDDSGISVWWLIDAGDRVAWHMLTRIRLYSSVRGTERAWWKWRRDDAHRSSWI